MSIVKKYKDSINKINLLVTPLKVKKVSLNKAPAKVGNYLENGKKGVDSDHIKIFKLDSKNNISFAFAFYYTKIPAPYIMATIKENETIRSSKFSELTFKDKLKQFVHLLDILDKSESLNNSTLEKTFINQFIVGNETNIDQEIEFIIGRITTQVSDLDKTNQELITKKIELENKIKKAKESVRVETNEARLKLKLDELEKKFLEATAKLRKAETKSIRKHLLENSETELYLMRKEIWEYESKKQSIINKECEQLPKSFREKIARKLEEKN